MTPNDVEVLRERLSEKYAELVVAWSQGSWLELMVRDVPALIKTDFREIALRQADAVLEPLREQLMLVLPAALSSCTGAFALLSLERSIEAFVSARNSKLTIAGSSPMDVTNELQSKRVEWEAQLVAYARESLEAAYWAALEIVSVSMLPSHQEILQARAQAQEALEKAQRVNVETQQLLQTAAFAGEARSFYQAQAAFGEQAMAWLVGVLASGFVLMCVLVFLMLKDPELPHSDQSWLVAGNLAQFGPRVALVSLLTTVLLVCVREQRTARHNQVANLHRANTVRTLRVLNRGGHGEVSNVLTMLAGQAVFASPSTGYDAADRSPTSSLGQISQELAAIRRQLGEE